jgi:tol-pal system protein YbgF
MLAVTLTKRSTAMTKMSQLLVTAGLMALGFSMPALAQDAAKIERRIGTLEGQMKAVQRKVFPGGNPRYFEPEVATGQAQAAPAAPGPGDNPLGDLQSRVDALEKQLATLTGQVEESNFKTRQMEENLTRLREDYEFRLQQLEGKGGATAAAAVAPGAAAPGAAAPTVPDTTAKPAVVPAPAPAAKPVAATPAKPAAAKPAPSPSRVAYEQAYAFVFEQKYDQAEPALLGFLSKYPDAPEASNATFWLGRTYFNRKLYAQAAKSFLEGYRKYPRGEKGADSLLGLGDSMVALGKPEEACQAYNELLQVYPAASATIKKRTADARTKAKCAA